MAVEIGALRALLSLDSAAFEKGAKRAQASMGKLERSLAQTSARLKKFGRTMSLRVTAPIVGAATAAVTSSLKIVDAQAKFAQSLDTTVVSVQNLTRASQLAGISQGDLDGSLRRMTRRISLAEQGTGAAAGALDQLNLAASDLADLPVDERVNLINKRIREMIPLAQQAGVASKIFGDKSGLAMLRLDPDVLSRASDEVQRFGAAMSEVAAKDIQAANDSISMIGLAMRGLSNQLTAALAPAIKTAAEAIAGAVEWFSNLSSQMRSMIGIAAGLAAAIGPVALALGLMVSGLSAAVGGVVALTGALFTLRGALMATGIGALIVGAGVLADMLFRLKNATGDWAEAIGAVLRVGKETFLGIGRIAWGASEILAGVASSIAGSFVRAFAEIAKSWDALVNGMASAWNAIADTALGDQLGLGMLGRSDIGGTLGNLADGLFDNALESIESGGRRIKNAGQGVADAITNIREILNRETETTDEATEKAKELAAALDDVATSASGGGRGGSGGAARAADELKSADKALQDFGKSSDMAADRFGDMVASIVTGSQSIADALKNIGNQLISSGISGLASSLFKSTGLGDMFAGLFDGGGTIPGGKFGVVGERGPEIVSGPARVTSRADTAKMMGGGQVGGTATIRIVAPEGFTAQQENRVQGIAVQVVSDGISEYDRRELPNSVERIQKDPRLVG